MTCRADDKQRFQTEKISFQNSRIISHHISKLIGISLLPCTQWSLLAGLKYTAWEWSNDEITKKSNVSPYPLNSSQEINSLSVVIQTLFDLIIQKRKAMGRVCLSKGILTLVTMRAAPSPFIASSSLGLPGSLHQCRSSFVTSSDIRVMSEELKLPYRQYHHPVGPDLSLDLSISMKLVLF